MSGADIVAALALGADATMVGRAYLYGLMAGGERGVDRAAEILSREIRGTMALLGVRSVERPRAAARQPALIPHRHHRPGTAANRPGTSGRGEL